MSLDFRFEGFEDRDDELTSPYDPDKWHPVANALVWMCLYVGVPKITDDTIDLFERRMHLQQAVYGPDFNFGDGTSAYLTRADLERYKGLHTNVSLMSDAKYRSTLIERLKSRAGRIDRRKPAFDAVAEKAAEREEDEE